MFGAPLVLRQTAPLVLRWLFSADSLAHVYYVALWVDAMVRSLLEFVTPLVHALASALL